ncbi:MAG: hypothetical protein AAF518_01445 [Spirochaetota bacterium]
MKSILILLLVISCQNPQKVFNRNIHTNNKGCLFSFASSGTRFEIEKKFYNDDSCIHWKKLKNREVIIETLKKIQEKELEDLFMNYLDSSLNIHCDTFQSSINILTFDYTAYIEISTKKGKKAFIDKKNGLYQALYGTSYMHQRKWCFSGILSISDSLNLIHKNNIVFKPGFLTFDVQWTVGSGKYSMAFRRTKGKITGLHSITFSHELNATYPIHPDIIEVLYAIRTHNLKKLAKFMPKEEGNLLNGHYSIHINDDTRCTMRYKGDDIYEGKWWVHSNLGAPYYKFNKNNFLNGKSSLYKIIFDKINVGYSFKKLPSFQDTINQSEYSKSLVIKTNVYNIEGHSTYSSWHPNRKENAVIYIKSKENLLYIITFFKKEDNQEPTFEIGSFIIDPKQCVFSEFID